MENIIIRWVKVLDMEQLLSLCQEHAEYEKAKFDPKNKLDLLSAHLFQSQNSIKCLVVEVDKEVVGYATFMKQFSTWDAGFYIYLDCLFLKEKRRGRGIGRKIMDQIRDYAQLEKCNTIQWQTPDFNTKAIEFYKRIGATSKAKERFFWTL